MAAPLPTAAGLQPQLRRTCLDHLLAGETCRSPGGTERGVPKGLGFSWVTCPNYFFETVAWTGFLMVNRNWTTVVFLVTAVGQMALWAKKKEVRYRKEGAGKHRYCMIPGIW